MTSKSKLIITGIVGFSIYNELQKRNDNPKVFYVNKIPGGFNGCILPPFGILITKAQKENKMLLKHELVHWKQYQNEGLVPFIINYWSEYIKKGYDLNSYEVEARLLSGEIPECLNNYTECVRKGVAKTVFNPSFKIT